MPARLSERVVSANTDLPHAPAETHSALRANSDFVRKGVPSGKRDSELESDLGTSSTADILAS